MKCRVCKEIIKKPKNKSLKDYLKRKFCSKTCEGISRRGKPSGVEGKHWKLSDEAKLKHSLALKGKPKSPESVLKRTGPNTGMWKGANVGYKTLHSWVAKNLGKPQICEHCDNSNLRPRQYHWANKSKKYLRDLKDWIRLCVSCHHHYDKEERKEILNRKKRNKKI